MNVRRLLLALILVVGTSAAAHAAALHSGLVYSHAQDHAHCLIRYVGTTVAHFASNAVKMYRGDTGGTPLTLTLDFCNGQALLPNQLCYVQASAGGPNTGAMSCSVTVPGAVTNFRGTLELRDVNGNTLVQDSLR
jgi:hypothetical protein